MDSTKKLFSQIENELNHIDILEKEYDLSAKKFFRTSNSNYDVLLDELLNFLLSITKIPQQTNYNYLCFLQLQKKI